MQTSTQNNGQTKWNWLREKKSPTEISTERNPKTNFMKYKWKTDDRFLGIHNELNRPFKPCCFRHSPATFRARPCQRINSKLCSFPATYVLFVPFHSALCSCRLFLFSLSLSRSLRTCCVNKILHSGCNEICILSRCERERENANDHCNATKAVHTVLQCTTHTLFSTRAIFHLAIINNKYVAQCVCVCLRVCLCKIICRTVFLCSSRKKMI